MFLLSSDRVNRVLYSAFAHVALDGMMVVVMGFEIDR
jgi:hypothetical protein